MTYRGKLMQIDRHGLNKNSEIGPIAKASFEEVMNIFTKAALFAEKDNMKGVSANILAGQFCKSGTNYFDILMDEDKLLEKIDIPDYEEEDNRSIIDEKDVDKAFSAVYNTYEETEDVKDSDFTFGFGMEQKKEYPLDSIDSSNVIISDEKNNGNELEKNIFDIPIDTEIKYNDNNQDIQFDSINIEEPSVPKKEKETKTKKIRVSKKKVKETEK
jgi:hypothetical protein